MSLRAHPMAYYGWQTEYQRNYGWRSTPNPMPTNRSIGATITSLMQQQQQQQQNDKRDLGTDERGREEDEDDEDRDDDAPDTESQLLLISPSATTTLDRIRAKVTRGGGRDTINIVTSSSFSGSHSESGSNIHEQHRPHIHPTYPTSRSLTTTKTTATAIPRSQLQKRAVELERTSRAAFSEFWVASNAQTAAAAKGRVETEYQREYRSYASQFSFESRRKQFAATSLTA